MCDRKAVNDSNHFFFSHFESEKIWASGLIVDEQCETPSHWNSAKTLDAWLGDNGIVGICGIDTRRLTQQIRFPEENSLDFANEQIYGH